MYSRKPSDLLQTRIIAKLRKMNGQIDLDLAKSLKSVITSKLVRWCGKNLRPFKISADDGFKQLAQELISIGSRHGNINIDEILPNERTVSRGVNIEYDKLTAVIIPEVKNAMNLG